MRFLQRCAARIRRLRPVFDAHLEVVVTVAVASSVTGSLAAGLILLADFRFDHVKVHRRFLAMRGESRVQFLKSVAALVHTLGAKVVVEGVESAAEHDVVQRSGIDLAQGYWYGKPMAVDQLRAFASATASIDTLHDVTGTEHGA